ncbi:MAG TPA: hypothetical protein VFS43_08015 [Polyangiaceae bacterium]|nr:hypothetical protein [Polyangiaceae bacterium]
MRAPTLVCALASSIVFASGVASAQEPTPAPSSPSNWFDPAPADQKKPTESKPAPDAASPEAPAEAAVEVPKAEPEKAKVPERPVEAAGSRARKRTAPEPPSDRLVWRPEMSRPKTNLVVGGGAGFVSGRFRHPDLYGNAFSGIAASVHAGVQVNPSILIGVDFDAYRTSVEYIGEGVYGYKGANNPRFLPPGAQGGGARLTGACTNCKSTLGGGGYVQSGPLNVLTLGPRLQFSAKPSEGLYGAVTGGFTFLEGTLKNQNGMSIGARGGYRFALSEQVGLALEAGTSAHRFEKTTAVFGFGGLQLQLRM